MADLWAVGGQERCNANQSIIFWQASPGLEMENKWRASEEEMVINYLEILQSNTNMRMLYFKSL